MQQGFFGQRTHSCAESSCFPYISVKASSSRASTPLQNGGGSTMADLSAWSFAWSSGSTFAASCEDMVVVELVVGTMQTPLLYEDRDISLSQNGGLACCDMRDAVPF